MANSQNVQPMQVSAGSIPKQGPAVLPFNLQFNTYTSYSLDLRGLQQLGFVENLQAIYVDNSGNLSPLVILVSTTNQQLIVPPQSQAFLPLFVSNNLVVSFSSVGGVVVPIFPINFPVAPAVWSVNGTGAVVAGAMTVSDTKLDAAIANNLVQTQDSKTGSGGTIYPDWIGNLSKVLTLSATGANTIVTGNPGYYVTALQLIIPANAVQASAGELTVIFSDSVYGAVWEFDAFVPALAGTLEGTIVLSTPPGFVWNNKNPNSILSVALSAALTTSHAIINVSYGLTTITG